MSFNKTILTDPIHFLAFGFGSGLLPKAPGTWGTLIAIPIWLLLSQLSLEYYLLATALLSVLGIWICGASSEKLGVHDHGGIVWDEICGFLVAMIAIPVTWYWLLLGFILFRFFDIMKPWPIKILDKKVKGGFGIMIDDIIAGALAAVILQLALYFLN
ncbi:phosphatidylglycerophosphatase A [Kangiella sp. HZ709]|uniref:phosphatidylglycerophosphatase A family protein n=1 Tax=Kangiella sp. HZ709 TaxID=2666328 RepID=UPI0012AFC7DC|nr:phosphatidylglycerophosphatase A [Kangiella sp. HZ709]MRX28675.1 phosphatidylglycerophosphatase A [Kangiella sp. HZ709]